MYKKKNKINTRIYIYIREYTIKPKVYNEK